MAVTSIVLHLAIAVLLLAGPVAAGAQPAAKVHRIGVVGTNSPVPEQLRQALREVGYVEGKNIVIEARFAEGRQERLPELVAQVLGQKVDVLVSISPPAALAAKKATTTVPVVFTSVLDPVASGLVAGLARPEGNLTGATNGVGGHGFTGKWVELLKEAFPGVSHVAVLWDPPPDPASAQYLHDIEAAARNLNMKVDVLRAGNAAQLDKAFASIAGGRAQAMLVTRSLFFTASSAKLVQFAASRRLPTMYPFTSFVEAGGLMSYAASQAEMFKSAATLVDRILKGARPAELPVQQPTRFELAINLRAAKALGLPIAQSVLLRADRVID